MKKIAIIVLCACSSVYAEPRVLPPVIDNSTYPATSASRASTNPTDLTTSTTSTTSNNTIYEVLERLEQLQIEIQQLRGIVEYQSQTIVDLKKRQGNIYSDLDLRIQELSDVSARISQLVVNQKNADTTRDNSMVVATNSQRVMQHPVAMTNTSADTTRDNSMMVATNSQRVMQHPVAMTNTSADTTRDNSMMVATDSQRVMQHPVAMTNTSADTTRDNSMMVATNSQRVMQHPVAMTNASSVVAEVPKIPVNQKDLYQVAYEMLRNGHHIRAIAAFKSLLIEFPDGEYADNSQYWLGEAYIVNDDREAAKVAFTKVVTHYGKSPKAPDALLKLGYMELEQNNIAKAKDYLTQVAFSHPGTTASYLATKKLRLIATE